MALRTKARVGLLCLGQGFGRVRPANTGSRHFPQPSYLLHKCEVHWSATASHASPSDVFRPSNSVNLEIIEVTPCGKATSKVMRRTDLMSVLGIQSRDLRFSTASSLFVRGSNIILRLEHIKAIIRHSSLILLESDHPSIQPLVLDLQQSLRKGHDLPFEFVVMETMLMKMLSDLDAQLEHLEPALRNTLNHLLDPQLFSIDKSELHILLRHSKTLSEFHSVVRDVETTLAEVLDAEDIMADMYLTHAASELQDRDPNDTEELCNLLEAYASQVENMLSTIQMLRELIDQSESVILINLDMQRNVMLRLSLQLEMGMFSAAISGLLGMAFGMNLQSSLEENVYAFWVVTGLMISLCGLLWRRLLLFLGRNWDKPVKKKLIKR